MTQIKFYVTLNVPDRMLSGGRYDTTCACIEEAVQELAECLKGDVEDVEIK